MALLDSSELFARLARMGVTSVEPLRGGVSSLTFRAGLAGRPVVVKVAPPGLAPVRHRDVLRQARVLKALHPTAVPVPEVLAEDPGAPPEVPPLFVMTFVPGQSVEPLFDLDGVAGAGGAAPEGAGEAPPEGATMAARLAAAAEVMATLHRLDPGPGGLGLIDEPVVGPAAEIDRWCELLETVDPVLVAGWQETAGVLRATIPAPAGPALVHGDFRLGNLLADGTRISAVVDWEIWSVGDPRIDVGWFLANADPATYRRRTPYSPPGILPTVEQLARSYCDAVGGVVDDLAWFMALARFKSAATWSLIVKHNRRRPDPDPDVEAMVPVLAALLEQSRTHVLRP